ncbi:MAG TPA: hypothetical protein VHW45_10360 [Candidatus Sulfotelmatobacter sp.]|nr:hypothetical protein [Candidatus Sulfotelmatobacter sp.]
MQSTTSRVDSRGKGALVACTVFVVLLMSPFPAGAHKGPPFPIIENRRVGPYVVALWTHPDVGTGTFFVLVDPVPGGKVPDDLKISIGVQPESGRLTEVIYGAQRDSTRGQVEYDAAAQFDRDEFWRVRLILQSSEGGGEALSRVEATPPGYGRWDLLLYMLPFLAIAFLWFFGMTRRRRQKARLRAARLADTAVH